MYILLFVVIIILIIEKFINKKTDTEKVQNKQLNAEEKIDSMAFSKKDYLLTQNELKLYYLLKQITDKLDLNLFCQVAMYELVNCKNFNSFNRIRSKSIDFVITEKNCKIKCCIELDDSTHNKSSRKERDNVIDNIFKNANTKLIRIKVQNFYNLNELEEFIKANI